MELHHPIMSKLWDLGGRTKRKKKERNHSDTRDGGKMYGPSGNLRPGRGNPLIFLHFIPSSQGEYNNRVPDGGGEMGWPSGKIRPGRG